MAEQNTETEHFTEAVECLVDVVKRLNKVSFRSSEYRRHRVECSPGGLEGGGHQSNSKTVIFIITYSRFMELMN